ncbi:Uncharacterized protein Adt_23670 [Abeliophyllum distichum]|uniref:Uncharacterized protein n=1 Tax=Abeliophyllum distichum TaxID=126358 RepID=A0ABD1SBY6_9LAMI
MDDNRVRDPFLIDVRNDLVPMVRPVEANEQNILMGEYMMPSIVENRSSIIYPPYGHDNFQLKSDVINLFSNNLPLYGRIDENPYYHISRFNKYCGNFKYYGINEKALRMRLFLHTLKDKAREWLDSLSAKVNRLKYKISNFQQSELENFQKLL